MATLNDYIQGIKELIQEARISEALDRLLELGKRFKIRAIQHEAIVLQGQVELLDKEKGRGMVGQPEYQAQLTRVNYYILDLLAQLEDGTVVSPVGTKRDKGRLIHNIPSRMGTGQNYYCSVRIARDDAALLRNFLTPEDTKPADIEVSRTMEVSLLDPTGGEKFAIRQISPVSEQLILEDLFTEWDFQVKALSPGVGVLLLYVFFIETIDGVKEKRSVALKRSIEVTTEKVAYYHPWEATNLTTEAVSVKQSKMFLGLVSAEAAKALLWILGGLAAVLTGLIQWKPMAEEIRIEAETYSAVLQIDSAIQVNKVQINDSIIYGWKILPDKNSVLLPPLPEGNYEVDILGLRGSCSQVIDLKPEGNLTFTMDCTVSPMGGTVSNDSLMFTLITPFDRPKMIIDAISIRDELKKTTRINNTFQTVVKLTKGRHGFIVQDPSNRYDCPENGSFETVVSADTVVQLLCTPISVNKPKYSIRVLVPNPLGDRYSSSIQLKMDNTILSVQPRIERDGAVFLLEGVEKGLHRFEIVRGKDFFRCNILTVPIERESQLVRFWCTDSKPKYKIKLIIPFIVRSGNNLRVLIDDRQVEFSVKNTGEKEAEITVPYVEYGNHKFYVSLKGESVSCGIDKALVNENNKIFRLQCLND